MKAGRLMYNPTNRKQHPIFDKCDVPYCGKPYYDSSEGGDYLCRKHWYEYIQVQLDSYNQFIK